MLLCKPPVSGLLLHHHLDNLYGGASVPNPNSSVLWLRVGVTRVTLGIAVSWTLLVTVAVTTR